LLFTRASPAQSLFGGADQVPQTRCGRAHVALIRLDRKVNAHGKLALGDQVAQLFVEPILRWHWGKLSRHVLSPGALR
jgi:hypothetical protein